MAKVQESQEPNSETVVLSSSPKPFTVRHLLADYRLWLLVLAFFAVGVMSLNDAMLYTPDCPRYLIWAKSLASFQGFKDTSNPDPTAYVVHAPLYPLLLAPLAWFFANIIIPAKVLTLVSGMALLILFYLWVARKTSKSAALVGAFFLAANPLTILLSGHVLSDIPFTLFIVLFFIIAEKLADRPDDERWAWGFVAVLTMGIFLREVGLTLLLGASSYLLLRREFRRLLLVFTIPMLFYLIWYFRNEVYIAGIENPPMRNMKIFLSHVFTGEEESLTSEFLVRLRINTAVYLNMAKGLVLFPQFLVRLFSVVAPTDPMMAGMTRILLFAQYPLIVLQYGLFGWGLIVRRKEKTFLLVVAFSVFYMMMILLYPINDLRFLVPVMILVLYYSVLGAYDVFTRYRQVEATNRALAFSGILLCLLLAIPNFAWTYNYIAKNREYLRNISDPSKPYVPEARTPELYIRPASLAGSWIARQPDSSSTVLARWKELTFWMNGKKMLDTDPLLSLTLFEAILRDYNVGYIVALVTDPGIREFEFQMLQSKRFAFTSEYRAGSLEVIKVHHLYREETADAKMKPGTIQPLPGATAVEEGARALFRQGIVLMETGRYDEAINVFNILVEITRGSGNLALFKGIALEFGGRFNEALWLFDRFRYQPQAGPFIKHAWYHQMLIRDFQAASRDSLTKYARAMIFHKISANYWDLGFRRRATEVLRLALQVDSAFTPGMVFGMYYSLQLGDTAGAKRFLSRLQKADSSHMIIKPMRRMFSLMDSVRLAKRAPERIGYQLGLARGYGNIGVRELTIDQTLAILREDPKNLAALELLATAYDVKDRRWPMIQILQRILEINPNHDRARRRLEELQSHL